MTKVTQSTVMRLSGAISQRIAAVVGHVHHAGAQLVENADEAQLIAHAFPVLHEGHAIGGEAQAHASSFFERDDFVCRHHLGKRRLEQVRGLGEVGKALDEPHGVAALLSGVLEDAGHAGGVEGVQEFLALALVGGVAVHGHGLAQVIDLGCAIACLDGFVHGLGIDGTAGGEAVALKHDGTEMQLPGVVDLSLSGLQQAERDFAGLVDGRITGDP